MNVTSEVMADEQVSKMSKVNDRRPRVVVITQGPDATIIASEGKVHHYSHKKFVYLQQFAP